MPNSPVEPERKKTDESLAGERAKADAALAEKAAIEQAAEKVIVHARDVADQVLANERATADVKLSAASTRDQTEAAIASERASEDRLVEELRTIADETLRKERQESARLLAKLIPLERDKTDRHLQTERARADDVVANRDDFLRMVTHDLRDLLSGIVLSTELIAETAPRNEQGNDTRAHAQRIQRSAGRMTKLIGDLVDVASIDAGKLVLHATVSDAMAAIREAIDTWGQAARGKGIELKVIEDGRVSAKFDHERVLQILGNLIMNALKFSSAGTTIFVGVQAIGAEARFSVKDSGVGIPADKLEAIFDRFSQAGNHDRRGLGLGLYISRCLVEAGGGKIWVTSEPGAGSTFFFTVPRA